MITAIITDDIETNKFDEKVNMELLKYEVDYRIEPHIISIEDYKNRETPVVEEVIDNGIKSCVNFKKLIINCRIRNLK